MKSHRTYNVKSWWQNMDKRTSYQHRGEDFDMKTIHMNQRCRLKRIGAYPSICIW